LLDALSRSLGTDITGEDLFAYVAAIVSHGGYTSRFEEELSVPGIRVPLSLDQETFREAVGLGKRILWTHTFGERFGDEDSGRPGSPPRLPVGEQPRVVKPIPDTPEQMPNEIRYDSDSRTLNIGAGEIHPVPQAVWEYNVSGMGVVTHWFGYRKQRPAGRRTSELNEIVPPTWTSATTSELLNLLNVIGLLVKLEDSQARLLERVMRGPRLTTTDLREAGVLPVSPSAREPAETFRIRREGAQTAFDET
jgi:hypothetical protein